MVLRFKWRWARDCPQDRRRARPRGPWNCGQATEILEGKPRTYRHDLETILHVFLWATRTNHNEIPPETSKLRLWSRGDWDGLARRRTLDMEQESFQSPRRILCPPQEGAIWIGTESSSEASGKLYNRMIWAVRDATTFEEGNEGDKTRPKAPTVRQLEMPRPLWRTIAKAMTRGITGERGRKVHDSGTAGGLRIAIVLRSLTRSLDGGDTNYLDRRIECFNPVIRLTLSSCPCSP